MIRAVTAALQRVVYSPKSLHLARVEQGELFVLGLPPVLDRTRFAPQERRNAP